MSDILGRPAEILLIEDNPADVRLVQEVFKEAKVVNRLSVAEDAEQALAALSGQANGSGRIPDLVLLDLGLPGMNGHELLAEIRSTPDLRGIPVVVLTGDVSEDAIGSSFELKANGYLSKPITVNKLMRVLEHVDGLSIAFMVSARD